MGGSRDEDSVGNSSDVFSFLSIFDVVMRRKKQDHAREGGDSISSSLDPDFDF